MTQTENHKIQYVNMSTTTSNSIYDMVSYKIPNSFCYDGFQLTSDNANVKQYVKLLMPIIFIPVYNVLHYTF